MSGLQALRDLFDGQLPEAVLFDLDGTLVDSVPDLAAAIDLALADANLPEVGVSRVRDWVGNGAQILAARATQFACAERVLSQVLSQTEVTEKETLVYQRFLYHYGHLPLDKKASALYDNVPSLLALLKRSGVKIALVTNKPTQFTPDILAQFSIAAFFDVLVCGDTLAQKKPSPEPLQHAVQRLGVSVETCVMVGDSSNDIKAAKACGMKSVSVDWGYNYSQDALQLGADLHIYAFAEWL